MELLDEIKTLEVLCLHTHQWGMFISWNNLRQIPAEDFLDELLKAVPYLNIQEYFQAIMEERAYLLFDTEEEMIRHYHMTVGDDGPTELNDYDGPLRVYAITCDPKGQLGYENT
jgi:hypothetical protein